MPEFNRKNTNTVAGPARRPRLSMHSGKCSICRHPRRAEIERDFLDWVGPWTIVREYGLGTHTAVYRHAHALGLFARRDRCVRLALGRLIEQVNDVRPTAATIVSAIRLLATLTAQGASNDEAEAIEDEDSPGASTTPDTSTTNAPAEEMPEDSSPRTPEPAEAIATARAASPSTCAPETEPGARVAESSSPDEEAECAAAAGAAVAAGPNASLVARELQPARASEAKVAQPAVQAKPAKTNGNGRKKRRGSKDESDDSAIGFAQTAGPRRRFFWR